MHGHAEREVREFRVVAVAFIAEEGVCAVEFVPREVRARGSECGVNFGAAFAGHVRVLASPDHEEFAGDLRNAVERIIGHAFPEGALVDVGRVEADRRLHAGIHRGAEGEVATEADAHGAELAGAGVVGFQVRKGRAGIAIVSGNFLGGFEGIATIGAGLIVGEDGASGLELVIDLRDGDNEAVAGEKCGGAADRGGDLKNLRVEHDARITAGRGRPEDVRAHRTGRRGEIDEGGFLNRHGSVRCMLRRGGSVTWKAVAAAAGTKYARAMINLGAKPDVLWIVTTQWRAQAFGYAGDPNAHTPRLDALAAEAVNFTQAVTPHPFGPFARAAMFTGVRSPENGVKDYFDPLPLDARTIAHGLSERGYATAFFGKWHLGKRDPAAALVGEVHARTVVPAEARGGFGFWEGFESGFLLNDPWLHGSRIDAPEKFVGYQSDVVCGRAVEWLRAREERAPVFCVVSLEAPHPPYDAPAGGVAKRREEEITLPKNVPRGGEVEARARRELAGYYAHIEATDAAIGRLLYGVDRARTLIVFTSVHGDMHGAHGLFRKGWPQEESVRVPLLVRLPVGRTEKGERRADALSLVDLPGMMTTFVERGVLETKLQAGARISMPSVVALPHQCDRAWTGVRTAERKLVLGPEGKPWLFFDLKNDPGEERNLVGDPAQVGEIAELRRAI